MNPLSPGALVRRRYYVPHARIPAGAVVELPGRGSTYVTDTPGPHPDSPTVVLLHAVGCTGVMTWFPSIEPLSRRYRVVTMDQRWHGLGIQSPEFSIHDCADDVAALIDELELRDVIVAGFSMGSIIAQRVWRQHPDKVDGLVLCATTDRFRSTIAERLFHQSLEIAMAGARGVSRSRTATGRRGRPPARSTSTPPTCTTGCSASSARPARGRSGRQSPRWAGHTPAPGSAASTCRPPSS